MTIMKKRNGFTLIELLVSAAIISGLGILLAQAFFTTTRSNTKVERLTDVKQNGEYALAVMEHMMRNSRSLAAGCTSDGSTASDSAAIVSPDGLTTTFTCRLDGDGTRIASVGALSTGYLTGNAVTIGGSSCDADTLAFYCTSIAGIPRSVKVTFSLSQKGTPQDQFEKASTTFQTSIGLRNQ
jgi:prepilin-type N-terminal cleavage/methylation domain-containing protein